MSFEDLVTGHLGWIARLAFKYYRDREDAEDLAQDTLLRILSNRDRYDSRYDFKPWVKTVMENIYKTRYARAMKVPHVGLEEDMPHASASMADQLTIVEYILDLIKRVSRCAIGVECVMLYAEGYNYDEIAERVGIGVGTVKSRIYQGRKALRKALGLQCQ